MEFFYQPQTMASATELQRMLTQPT